MRLGNAAHDMLYQLIRLSAARWFRETNELMRMAWLHFATETSREVLFMCRMLHQLLRGMSPICRSLSALEFKSNPEFVFDILRTLANNGRYSSLLEASPCYFVTESVVDRLENYLALPPHFDLLIGGHRIYIESQLCLMAETINDKSEKSNFESSLVLDTTTRVVATICMEDSEHVSTAIAKNKVCESHISHMLLWIELCNTARKNLPIKDFSTPDPEFDGIDIQSSIEKLNSDFLQALCHHDSSLGEAITDSLAHAEKKKIEQFDANLVILKISESANKSSNIAPPLSVSKPSLEPLPALSPIELVVRENNNHVDKKASDINDKQRGVIPSYPSWYSYISDRARSKADTSSVSTSPPLIDSLLHSPRDDDDIHLLADRIESS